MFQLFVLPTLPICIHMHCEWLRGNMACMTKMMLWMRVVLAWYSLAVRIFTILSLVLEYARLCRDDTQSGRHPSASSAKFQQIAHDFRSSHNFLLRVCDWYPRPCTLHFRTYFCWLPSPSLFVITSYYTKVPGVKVECTSTFMRLMRVAFVPLGWPRECWLRFNSEFKLVL